MIAVTVLKGGNEVGTILGNPKQLEIQRTAGQPGQPQQQQPPPQATSYPPPPQQNPYGSVNNGGMQQSHGQQPMKHEPGVGSGSSYQPGSAPKTPTQRGFFGSKQASPPSQRNIFPISSLNPYQGRWTIRARVTSKPPIRTYNNSRGEGKVMSVDLVDESGEIRATAFNETAERLHRQFELDKVYFVSRCQVKTANKQFTSLKNDYEITFRDDSEVEECMDGGQNLPKMQYNFVTIAQLEQTEKDNLIDIIGVVKSAGELTSITTRQTNRKVSKRDIQLVDKTDRVVSLTLWGAEAEAFDGSKNPVLVIRGARVSDFGGRSLSTLSSSTLLVNPDLKEAHELRGWFEHVGKTREVQSISNQAGAGSMLTPTIVASQIKSLDLGRRDKPDYFDLAGTITYIRKENCMYKACPSADCNKKVTEGMGGHGYFCEKCNQHFPDFKWRLMLTVCVADYSGGCWITMFQDQAETVLGRKAQEIGELREQNEVEFDCLCQMANFQDYIVRSRAKMDTWQDEQRVRLGCVAVNKINYAQEAKKLLEETKKLQTM